MVGQGKDFRLTPREGMRLGMDRADFRMAEMFARQILLSDPDDVSANFVMGMFYFGNEQYGRAEVYLKKCLEIQPKSAGILNNLAVAQLRQGHLEEAEVNVRRALEVAPESLEARRTLSNVLKEKEAAEQKRREQGLKP
jgi:Tfp pilus assembly protein PilF